MFRVLKNPSLPGIRIVVGRREKNPMARFLGETTSKRSMKI